MLAQLRAANVRVEGKVTEDFNGRLVRRLVGGPLNPEASTEGESLVGHARGSGIVKLSSTRTGYFRLRMYIWVTCPPSKSTT